MTLDIPIHCRCGKVRGKVTDVSPSSKNLAICYCDDCQIYALHLGCGAALNERGGTEALLASPAQVQITQGMSEMRCMRLSPKGLYRWYAGCCDTPIANSIQPSMPVMIVPTIAVDLAGTGKSKQDALGVPELGMMGRFAKGGTPPGASAKIPLKAITSMSMHMLRGFLKGRSKPSPFFDDDGKPKLAPHMIDRDEREKLRSTVLHDAGL